MQKEEQDITILQTQAKITDQTAVAGSWQSP